MTKEVAIKDYYKILGVRENSSEEEIRQHWVEWMRRLHPDQHQTSVAKEKRVREINEAYQVLKHSSTRVEYDLRRAHERRKKGSPVRRIFVPVFVLCLVLIPAFVYVKYVKKIHIGVPSVSSTEPQPQSIVLREADRQGPVVSENVTMEPLSAGPPEKADATVQKALDVETGPVSRTEPDRKRNGSKTRRPRPADERENSIDRKIGDQEVRAKKPDRPQAEVRIPAPEWIQVSDVPGPPVEAGLNVPPAVERMNGLSSPGEEQGEPVVEGMNGSSLPVEEQGKPPVHDPVSVAASAPQEIERPVSLPAAGDEVRGFLDLYAERYRRKDTKGFLSLFSQKAVQNGKDGFERIREVYSGFLDHSKEIRYRLYDVKIEIYQNVAEVKSRYELAQRPETGGSERVWRGQIRWVLTKENGALKIVSLDYQSEETR